MGTPWLWTLAFGHHEDRFPTHGYAEMRETAMTAFAKSWRRMNVKAAITTPAMRIWASMSQRACPVFGSIVLAILIAPPAAYAVCRSPKNICKHIDDCLQRTNKDADQIKEGVRTRNGKMVWAGAEACARDLGRKRQWDGWARECSDLEYVSIAKVEMELGKVYCDRYSQ